MAAAPSEQNSLWPLAGPSMRHHRSMEEPILHVHVMISPDLAIGADASLV
jgi:hypothetical protein